MKTIHELNEKWWYRLIKVIFIFSALGALIVFVSLSYSFLSAPDFNNAYVKCDDGRIITVDELSKSGIVAYYYINPDYENKVKTICKYPNYKDIEKSLKNRNEFSIFLKYDPVGGQIKESAQGLTEAQILYLRNKYGVTTADNTSYELKINYIYRVPNSIGFINLIIVIGWFVGIIAIFEILRRVFYYIVLGTIKPTKIVR